MFNIEGKEKCDGHLGTSIIVMLSVCFFYILPPSRIEETQKSKISCFFLSGEIRLLENKCKKDRL